MYVTINDKRYPCKKRIVTPNEIKFLSVSPKPENPSGFIRLFTDNDFELSCDNIDSFLRTDYNSTIFILTNLPVPQPVTIPPDTRTNAEKRQEAYEKGGYAEDHTWYIEWNEKQYTCDELSQLGMRYEFREEMDVAEEIKELVENKVKEIREYYPDETDEENGEVK